MIGEFEYIIFIHVINRWQFRNLELTKKIGITESASESRKFHVEHSRVIHDDK